jgi:hypothetical protein
MGQQRGIQFEDRLNNEMRVALHDFVEAATICNWCADECLGDAQMERCARLCRDVGDLAALNIQFMSRDSVFGPDLAETFAYAAEECRQECAQHQDDHCQECASVLGRAVESTWAMLDSLHGTTGGSGQMQTQTQMSQY